MILKALLAAAASTAVLATTGLAQTPKRGGTLTYAVETEVPKLDCHQEVSQSLAAMVRPMYSTLIRFDQNNFPNLLPDLAESWTVSPDGLTYTFKTRQGVKFHDGSPFSAADVKASFDRIRTPPAQVASQRRLDFADVESIETPDATTVVFKLSQRNAALLELIAHPHNCIYSARKLAENPLYPVTTPMGTGAFVFVSYTRGSDRVARRFTDYFRPGLPYVDELKLLVMAPATLAAAVEAGQIDAYFRSMTPQEAAVLKRSLGDKITVDNVVIGTATYLTINNQRKPLDDARVRRAISLAFDRWGTLAGIQTQANQMTVGGLLRPGYDLALTPSELEKLPGFGRDPEASRAEARRLLAEAGVPNMKITLTNRNNGTFVPVGVLVIDQLRRAGFDATQESLVSQVAIDRQQKGDFDLTLEGYGGATDDPNGTLTKFLPGAGNNLGKINDPLLKELFDKQKGELDRAKRRELTNAFERRVLEQAYIAPLFYAGWMPGMRSHVKNWRPTSNYNMGYDMTEVWLDK